MCGFDSRWAFLIQDVGKPGIPRALDASNRGFESLQDYFEIFDLRFLIADLVSVQSIENRKWIRPRRAARSARHPVKVETVSSNPIGDACTARYANRQSGEAQTFVIVCGFDSHPCYSIKVGVPWRAKLVVTQWSRTAVTKATLGKPSLDICIQRRLPEWSTSFASKSGVEKSAVTFCATTSSGLFISVGLKVRRRSRVDRAVNQTPMA